MKERKRERVKAREKASKRESMKAMKNEREFESKYVILNAISLECEKSWQNERMSETKKATKSE